LISVLTLNLRFGLAGDGPNRWEARREVYPDFFSRYPVDFMAFQEANDFQIEDLGRMLPGCGLIGRRKPAPPFWQNNVIFFRKPWTCLSSDYFFLSDTPGIPSRSPESRWPRQCIIGLFESGKRRLACVNTHFDFDAQVQEKSAHLILERLAAFPPAVPVLLMGDFNASPGDACYRVLTEPPVCRLPGDRPFVNCFRPPYPGTHHGFSGTASGRHIDWILYRGALVPIEARVIEEPIEDIYPSDHFPLVARFRWGDEPQD